MSQTIKMSDNDSSIGEDFDPQVIQVITTDKMLHQEGLLLAGFSLKKQAQQPKSMFVTFRIVMVANQLSSVVFGKIHRPLALHQQEYL